MTSKYNSVFVVLLMGTSLFAKADAIECYVCRGCEEVGPADVQTCPAAGQPTTEEPVFSTLEPTTDQDMHFDSPIKNKEFQVAEYPFLEEEEREPPRSGFVVDNSVLPGSEFLSRTLKQYRDANDDARCVITIFEVNGQRDVIRGCSTASENQETRCLEAIGDGFTGTVTYCILCGDDLCNSAAKSAIALVLVIVGVLVNINM